MWATSGGSPSRARRAAMPSGRTSAPLLPAHQRRWAAPPTRRCRTAAARRAGRTTSRAARRRSGTPRLAQVVDGGDDRAGDVVAGLGPVPVGGAVVGPVRRAASRGRRASDPGARCRPATAGARPRRRGTAGARRRPAPPARWRSRRATSSRSPCQPQRTVPPLSPTVWSWKASSGATRSVRPSGAPRSSGQPVGGRWGSRKKPSRAASAWLGRPNSQCWKATARRPSGAPRRGRSAGREHRPADRRLVEGPGGEAGRGRARPRCGTPASAARRRPGPSSGRRRRPRAARPARASRSRPTGSGARRRPRRRRPGPLLLPPWRAVWRATMPAMGIYGGPAPCPGGAGGQPVGRLRRRGPGHRPSPASPPTCERPTPARSSSATVPGRPRPPWPGPTRATGPRRRHRRATRWPGAAQVGRVRADRRRGARVDDDDPAGRSGWPAPRRSWSPAIRALAPGGRSTSTWRPRPGWRWRSRPTCWASPPGPRTASPRPPETPC